MISDIKRRDEQMKNEYRSKWAVLSEHPNHLQNWVKYDEENENENEREMISTESEENEKTESKLRSVGQHHQRTLNCLLS
jgi:hypothetical protein